MALEKCKQCGAKIMDGFYNNNSKKEQIRERPIPFTVSMVEAILDGRKTQTRRVIKPPPDKTTTRMYAMETIDFSAKTDKWYQEHMNNGRPWTNGSTQRCPHGKTGDRLWVRETYVWNPELDRPDECKSSAHCFYRADGEIYNQLEDTDGFTGWKSSRFMPRWASRITLEITDVRVEKLNDISEEDAIAEGIYSSIVNAPSPLHSEIRFVAPGAVMTNVYGEHDDHALAHSSAKKAFKTLWDGINGKAHPWESNPWVWVIEFKPLNTSMNESDKCAI